MAVVVTPGTYYEAWTGTLADIVAALDANIAHARLILGFTPIAGPGVLYVAIVAKQ